MAALRHAIGRCARAVQRHSALVLLAVAALAVADAASGRSSVNQGLFLPLAMPAAFALGTRESGLRLLVTAIVATFALTFANQLDPSDTYGFLNDLVFFAVVSVGGPALAGTVVQRRAALIRGLTEHARRLRAERRRRPETVAVRERARLHSELNAVLTDRVAEIAVQAAGAEQVLGADRDRARAALAEVEQAARGVLDDLRRVLGVLRVGDEDLALVPAPSLSQVDRLERSGAATVTVRGARGQVDPAIDATAFRVAQDALGGAAQPAQVTIDYQPRKIRLEVLGGRLSADGRPSVHHRLRLFGGRCQETDDAVTVDIPRRARW